MQTYRLLLLSLLAVLISACENEIPFNLKDNPPKLIMNALINADSPDNTLFLNMTGRDQVGYVSEATVEVRVNGVLTETAQPIPKSPGHSLQNRFRITTAFHPGDLVRIDAITTDGKHHAWAEVSVPHSIAIQQVDTLTVKRSDNNGFYPPNGELRYKVTFKDRPNEKNFYRLVLEQTLTYCAHLHEADKDTTLIQKQYSMNSNEDIVLTDGRPGNSNSDGEIFEQTDNIYGVFDDTRFTNSEYTMTVFTSKYNWLYVYESTPKWSKIDVAVRLLSISETEYYYLKALNLIDSGIYDETMTEPIKFASNVNGGLGLVSISTETSTSMNIIHEVYP